MSRPKSTSSSRSPRRSSRTSTREISRVEKKAQTRALILDSALELSEELGSFSNVSIREITKKVGISPSAFYRHFNDLDELGLELVDEVGIYLRKIIRNGRQREFTNDQMIRQSLQIYIEYVEEHRSHFIFALQARTSGAKTIQSAIRSEFRFFSLELVSDLSTMGLLPNVNGQDLEMISELVVNTVAFGTVDLLNSSIHQKRREEVLNTVEQQMRVIFLGASQWKSK